MKRTVEFVRSLGVVSCTLRNGERVDVPVVPGILKHPRAEDLPRLLQTVDVVEKYVSEVLRKAPWSVVREFPRSVLLEGMARAQLSEGRRRALEFMLSDDPGPSVGQAPAASVESFLTSR